MSKIEEAIKILRAIGLPKAQQNERSALTLLALLELNREFKRHIDNIAWETEVWIENNPDHMIHFNGEKFFTAY